MKDATTQFMTEDQIINKANECQTLNDIEAIKKLAGQHLNGSDLLTKERVMKVVYFNQYLIKTSINEPKF
jgi:hypothetical protein